MPESPVTHRLPRPTRVQIGAAAVTAATVLGLSAGVANAAAVSAPALTASNASNASPVLDGSGPALDLAHQAPTGLSPLAPAARSAAPSQPAGPVVRAAAATQPSGLAPGNHTTAAATTQSAAHSTSTPGQSSGQHQAAAPAPAPQPFTIYDSVTPTAIPGGQIVATYANGPFAVPSSQVTGRSRVFWIDVNGSDTSAAALDVEPGDATPSMAASWTWRKLNAQHNGIAVIYTMRSEWPATQAAVGRLPGWMQSRVRWWIADPTGYPHLVPGSSATQWYWGSNYDISTAQPGF